MGQAEDCGPLEAVSSLPKANNTHVNVPMRIEELEVVAEDAHEDRISLASSVAAHKVNSSNRLSHGLGIQEQNPTPSDAVLKLPAHRDAFLRHYEAVLTS